MTAMWSCFRCTTLKEPPPPADSEADNGRRSGIQDCQDPIPPHRAPIDIRWGVRSAVFIRLPHVQVVGQSPADQGGQDQADGHPGPTEPSHDRKPGEDGKQGCKRDRAAKKRKATVSVRHCLQSPLMVSAIPALRQHRVSPFIRCERGFCSPFYGLPDKSKNAKARPFHTR